ncbi:MAG: LacI family DNA-binding transcriptional regulator [Bacteroidota bacterium]
MNQKRGNHIRIKDIAERAGCSIGTVDRVLHNRGKVSEPVKKLVLDIIKELDYKPNADARGLASKRPVTLGILLPPFRKGEYWELPYQGINEAIGRYEELGHKINTIRLTYNNPEKFSVAGMKLLRDEIDGIIMSPASYKESVRLVRSYFQNNIPFVLIDSDIRSLPSLSFIGKDPVQTGMTVAKLMHQITRHIEGEKKIWTINLAKNLDQMYPFLARESGFMNYFAEKSVQNEYTFRALDIEDQGSQGSIDQTLEKLMARETPHAIYVTGSRVHKIAMAIKRLKPDPKPLLIGHDLIKANMNRIKDESIDFLIEEEARRQGYLAVESLIRRVIYKEKIEKKQWMNLLIYTSENLPSAPDENVPSVSDEQDRKSHVGSHPGS